MDAGEGKVLTAAWAWLRHCAVELAGVLVAWLALCNMPEGFFTDFLLLQGDDALDKIMPAKEAMTIGGWLLAGLTLVALIAWAVRRWMDRPADPAQWNKMVRETRTFFIGLAVGQGVSVSLMMVSQDLFSPAAPAVVGVVAVVWFGIVAALAVLAASPAVFRAAWRLR